ncbi:MAG: transposase, partial [Bacillota bacterium]
LQGRVDKAEVVGAYEPWVVETFSGVLSIDEVYDKRFGILFATDPVIKIVVGHLVNGANITQEEIKEFLLYLKNMGLNVRMVITDGSHLYSDEVLKDIFPEVEHQLCHFHLLKNISQDALKSIKGIRDEIKSLIPKRGKGRPKKGDKEENEEIRRLKKDKGEIFKDRFLFMKREENLSVEEKVKREKLEGKYPKLKMIRGVISVIHELFSSQTYEAARDKYEEILRSEFIANPLTCEIIGHIKDRAVFEKAFTYLRLRIPQRTNNHVERQNRWFRKIQKSCNKLRKSQTITNRINLDIKMHR